MTDAPEQTKSSTEIVEMARAQHVALLATHEGGRIVTRPMGVQEVSDEAELWFFAQKDSDLVSEIEQDPRVNVSFSDGTYLSFAGTAEVIQDPQRARELWSTRTEAWMQCEPEDEKVRLVRVESESVAWWQTPSGPRHLLGVAKATLTDSRPGGGDSGAMDL